DAARARQDQAEAEAARIQQIRPRRPGARHLPAVVAAHRAVPRVCEGLEDRPEPLRQPGPRHRLARQVGEAGMRTNIWAAVGIASALATPALTTPTWAADTPKHGGTLTYMIPADAPPSLDG